MILVEILVIAIGLSLDVFAYALCKGAMTPEIKKENMVKLCLIFTVWQVISLYLGKLVTLIPGVSRNANDSSVHWKYISVGIFLCLGVYMILKALKQQEIEERKEEYISIKQICVWACITSIDAFLAGIGFGFFQTDFLITAVTVGIVTLTAVITGVYVGYWMGCQANKKVVTFGGCLLLLGGVELIIRVL